MCLFINAAIFTTRPSTARKQMGKSRGATEKASNEVTYQSAGKPAANIGVSAFENLDDAELMRIEDALSNEIQTHSINEASSGLDDYGELYRSCIIALPD